MSDVALWVEEAIVYLADLTTPLQVNLEGAKVVVPDGATAEREASLGTVPDFSYSGAGIRISGVMPNSAAADAGLQAGDVLLTYNNETLSDLQTYSNLLRQSAPGDVVQMEVRRAQQTLALEAILQAR
jgi:S1-C subfamily serine protease